LLGAHYRVPIQFDTEKLDDGRVVFPGIEEAERRVDYVYSVIERLSALASTPATPSAKPPKELAGHGEAAKTAEGAAEAGLDDDLNSPIALASLGELARLGNELCDLADKRKKDAVLLGSAVALAQIFAAAVARVTRQLGVCQTEPALYRERTRARRLRVRGITPEQVEARLKQRTDARNQKDFQASDRIRAELAAIGVTLYDSPQGTTWAIAP
jgi:cysteinyl-tRNA synthetase